jgi:hypothetical protein
MGIDMRLHIEVQVDGVWEHYSCTSVRNSRLFDYFIKYSKSDTVPLDATRISVISLGLCCGDVYSFGVLGGKEISEVRKSLLSHAKKDGYSMNLDCDLEFIINRTWLFGGRFAEDDMPIDSIGETRFIFWFDGEI